MHNELQILRHGNDGSTPRRVLQVIGGWLWLLTVSEDGDPGWWLWLCLVVVAVAVAVAVAGGCGWWLVAAAAAGGHGWWLYIIMVAPISAESWTQNPNHVRKLPKHRNQKTTPN